MSDFDAVMVGSGINGLVCSALLARAGWKVCLLERNDYLGGAIRTAEITRPGYVHELYSAWHTLFVAGNAYKALKPDLDAQGLTYLNAPLSTATIDPSGQSACFGSDLQANIAELERLHPADGSAYQQFLAEFQPHMDLLFEFLGAPIWSAGGEGLLAKARERMGPGALLAFAGEMLGTCRDWLTQTFQAPETHGLFAPWILHAGLGPESTLSGMMMRVFAATLQFVGVPVPKGGGSQLVAALQAIIRAHGGECHTGADATRVIVQAGRAVGVQLASGEQISTRHAVVCSVTPTQLYGRLLASEPLPAALGKAVKRFRYGPACMQLHLALSEAPQWAGAPRLRQSPVVNVTSGLDGVSKAWNEGVRGLLPAEPSLFVGQPAVVDPSRAPAGGAVLMIQLLGLPAHPKGDAAGSIATPGAIWTDALREQYADRVLHVLGQHIPNLSSALLERVVIAPHDLAAANINLVGGDPYGGSLEIDQHYWWRPMPGHPGYHTPVQGLYQIGASTYPGHGLGGGSGFLLAQELVGDAPL